MADEDGSGQPLASREEQLAKAAWIVDHIADYERLNEKMTKLMRKIDADRLQSDLADDDEKLIQEYLERHHQDID